MCDTAGEAGCELVGLPYCVEDAVKIEKVDGPEEVLLVIFVIVIKLTLTLLLVLMLVTAPLILGSVVNSPPSGQVSTPPAPVRQDFTVEMV